jgi:hypothetical protein
VQGAIFNAPAGSLAEKDAKARAAKPEDFADLSIIKELDQQAY